MSIATHGGVMDMKRRSTTMNQSTSLLLHSWFSSSLFCCLQHWNKTRVFLVFFSISFFWVEVLKKRKCGYGRIEPLADIYAMAPQYAAPLHYQYYTIKQPLLVLPYSSLYFPPFSLPCDNQG
jgi:hypothetical protein